MYLLRVKSERVLSASIRRHSLLTLTKKRTNGMFLL